MFFVLKFLKEINTSPKKKALIVRESNLQNSLRLTKIHRDENLFSPVWELKNSRNNCTA